MGFTSLGMFITSCILFVFGSIYEIPNENPIVDVFKLLLSGSISLGFIWIFLYISKNYKEW